MANRLPPSSVLPATNSGANVNVTTAGGVTGVTGVTVAPESVLSLTAAAGARTLVAPRIFGNELRTMMYGFGDSSVPRGDSVRLMEELMLHYVSALVKKTTEVAHTFRRERPDIGDIKFVIRKDRRKLQRVRYLLDMKTEIKSATSLNPDEIVAEKAQK